MIAGMATLSRRTIAFSVAGILLLLAAGLAFDGPSIIRNLDHGLQAERMALAPRRPTGGLVFISIDKKSLDRVGVWPWPRSIYADALKRLTEAGARDIAFDIDFSNASVPDEDNRFAAALAEAGGGVILPAFLQRSSSEGTRLQLVLSEPIKPLADNAWIGAVNVVPGTDGKVRDMPYGIDGGSGVIPSIPTLLAQSDLPESAGAAPEFESTRRFPIDFGIDPAGIPTYSISTLLDGKLADGAIRGKSVLIGAHAVELKDYFNVPVHGNIPGPVVQLLAAETLIQGRTIVVLHWGWTVGAAAVLVCGFLLARPRRLSLQLLLLAGIALGVEAAAFQLYRGPGLDLRTAGIDLVLLATAIARIVIELDVRGWLARVAAIETRNTRQILEQVINDNSDGILVADEAGQIVELNRRMATMFRPATGVGTGSSVHAVLPERMIAEAERIVRSARENAPLPLEEREIVLEQGGLSRYLEYTITPSSLETAEGKSYVFCVTARDVTERKEQEKALDRLSRYDQLTGALRQTEFVSRLDAIFKERQPGDERILAVYSINLHRFKTINSTLGRDVGDELLAKVAETLATADPGVLLVGRTGGDSFCLARLGSAAHIEKRLFADTLIRALSAPFTLGEHRARVGAHIGFASFDPANPADAAVLLDHAEFALDEARAINGSGWVRFDPAASIRINRSREVERELWRSLERQEIFLTYQPQVALDTGELVGVEALVRWNHPQFGMISPGDFVEIAEANGFVEKLGQWVLNRACEDAIGWQKPIPVAVNVSPLQFTRGDVVDDVKSALALSGLPPERLHLEITESTFLGGATELVGKLETLKSLGVSLALDDFGTGYSSFGYLSKFPLDKLKVDQMFVRNLGESAQSRAIVRSVAQLCQGLDITMLCEGIETEEQRQFLLQVGCEQGQGYLFGKPQPNEAILSMTASVG